MNTSLEARIIRRQPEGRGNLGEVCSPRRVLSSWVKNQGWTIIVLVSTASKLVLLALLLVKMVPPGGHLVNFTHSWCLTSAIFARPWHSGHPNTSHWEKSLMSMSAMAYKVPHFANWMGRHRNYFFFYGFVSLGWWPKVLKPLTPFASNWPPWPSFPAVNDIGLRVPQRSVQHIPMISPGFLQIVFSATCSWHL